MTGIVSLLARAMRIDVAEVPAEIAEIHQKIESGVESLDKEDACLFSNKGAIHGVATRWEPLKAFQCCQFHKTRHLF